MVKHSQTIFRQKSTNCLSVFDHFVWQRLKGLITVQKKIDTRIIFHQRLELFMSPCQINKNVKIILTLLIFSIDKTSALRDLNFTIISLLSSQYSHQNTHSLTDVLDLYYLHEKAC